MIETFNIYCDESYHLELEERIAENVVKLLEGE